MSKGRDLLSELRAVRLGITNKANYSAYSYGQIGDIIRQRRELLGLLQPQLSDMSGVCTRTIQLVEQGKGNPSLDTLLNLAFLVFAEMIGVVPKLATKVVDDMIARVPLAEEFVGRSFMSNEAKKKYIEIMRERSRRLAIK